MEGSTRPSTAATFSRRSSSPPPPRVRSPPSASGSSRRWAPTCSSSRRGSRCSEPGSTRVARHPRLQLPCTGVFTAHDPDRRLPRRRPAGGDVRDRAGHGALAAELGIDPIELRRRNFITEFPKTIASGLTIDSGDYPPRSTGRSSTRPRRGPRRAGGAARAGGREAARSRALDLRRDVRPRAVRDPRRDPLRRGRLGRGHDPLPPERHGAGAHRHVAAWARARDGVVADHRRRARLRRRRDRGACTAAPQPARDGHVRQPQPHRRRDRAAQRGPEDRREGAHARGAPARRRRERARPTRAGTFGTGDAG